MLVIWNIFFPACLLTRELFPEAVRKGNHIFCHYYYMKIIDYIIIVVYFLRPSVILFICGFWISPEMCPYSRISKQEGLQRSHNLIILPVRKGAPTQVQLLPTVCLWKSWDWNLGYHPFSNCDTRGQRFHLQTNDKHTSIKSLTPNPHTASQDRARACKTAHGVLVLVRISESSSWLLEISMHTYILYMVLLTA